MKADEMPAWSQGESIRSLGLLPFAVAACFALSATMLTNFPIIAPHVVAELRLNYVEAGLITSAYMFGYGLFQIPAGLLGMRFGSERGLVGAAALMCAAALIGAFIGTVSGWIVARLLLGIGGAAVLPLSLDLLTRAFSGKRLMKGISIFVSGWGLGMTLALLGAAPILHAYGWREVMLASAALGVLVLVLLRRSLSQRESDHIEQALTAPGLRRQLLDFCRNYRLNLMGLVNAAGTTTMICVPSWLPLYLTGAFDASPAEASGALSSVGLAVFFGGWSGGALAIRIGWQPVVVGSLIVSAVLVSLIPLLPSVILVVALAALIGWTAMLFPAPIQSLFPGVVSGEWAALAAAYYNTVGFIGAFAASLVFGLLVDWSGSFAMSWLWLAVVPWVGVAAALSFPAAARTTSASGGG